MCFFRHAGRCQSGWPGKKVTLAKKGQVTLQTKCKFAIVHVANKNKSCEENWRGPVPNKSLSGVSILILKSTCCTLYAMLYN